MRGKARRDHGSTAHDAAMDWAARHASRRPATDWAKAEHVPPTPAAGDFERRVTSTIDEAYLPHGSTDGRVMRALATRAIRAEDRVEVLERALKTIRFCARAANEKGDAWAKIVLKAVDETRAAISAEPRK